MNFASNSDITNQEVSQQMKHTSNLLAKEFPPEADRIAHLTQSDAHFAHLVGRYHDVVENLHRAETNVGPADERHGIEMRKTRMALKDQLWRIISDDARASQ